MWESAQSESEWRTKYDGWCSRWCELKARNFFVVLLMLFCWEIAREKKERYGRSSFWSIEQLVVVISYKNHFTLLQLTREKYLGTFYDVDRKREVFSFSLVFIAFNSTRARAFYFSLFLPFSSSSVSIFSQKQFFPKSREEKKEVWLSWGSDLESITC